MTTNIYFHTFGCKVNISESEDFAKKAAHYGFNVVSSLLESEIVVINSCAVTKNAERKCRDFIKKAKKSGKKVVLAGCFAHIVDEESKRYVDYIFKNPEKSSIIKKLADDYHHSYSKIYEDILLPHGKTRAFLKIQDGCDSYCSYCIIPHLRGKPVSVPVNEVMERFNKLINAGYKEIVLVGIHIGKYGVDIGADLKEILKRLLDVIGEREIRLRLTSLDVNEMDEELVGIVKNSRGKICNHFHISLQSGSDKILKKMNRRYKSSDFIEIVKFIKSEIEDVRIGTDVIVGFPGEDDNDFNLTLKTLDEADVDFIHIFTYSKREGTKAAKFHDEIPKAVKQKRREKLQIFADKKREKAVNLMIGKTVRILAENSSSGYSDNYHYVKVKNNLERNRFYQIKVKGLSKDFLIGEVYE